MRYTEMTVFFYRKMYEEIMHESDGEYIELLRLLHTKNVKAVKNKLNKASAGVT